MGGDQLVFSPIPCDRSLAGGTVCVDLAAVKKNWCLLQEKAGKAEAAATVKGDAYGLGIGPVATALWQVGCRSFFVALPNEGIVLRRLLPRAVIYVLDGLLPGSAGLYLEHELRPVLNAIEEIEEWALHGSAAAIHIETGMNRLGLTAADVEQLADSPLWKQFELSLIVSHLARADEPGNEMNLHQREIFEALCAKLPAAPRSLANSPGCFLGADFAYDMVRPGVALFGGNPFAARSNPMQTVAYLYAPILQIRELASGETVGYGGSWQAERPSRIAVLGLGYRDGYHRSLSYPAKDGPAQVAIAGCYAPVVGRVSMDMITVDITDIPEELCRRGSLMEVMGDHVSVDDIALWAGTIPYEILTSLGSRYARVYAS